MAHVSRFVALAAMGRGREVGAVGFEHQAFERHAPHGLGQCALAERHHASDAEEPVARGREAFIDLNPLRISMEHAPKAASLRTRGLGLFAHDAHHRVPRRTRVHGYRQVVPARQAQLCDERLALFAHEAVVPVEVESDFAHGAERPDPLGRRVQQPGDQRQLLAPARGLSLIDVGWRPIIAAQRSGWARHSPNSRSWLSESMAGSSMRPTPASRGTLQRRPRGPHRTPRHRGGSGYR